jgi:hypothetical protein
MITTARTFTEFFVSNNISIVIAISWLISINKYIKWDLFIDPSYYFVSIKKVKSKNNEQKHHQKEWTSPKYSLGVLSQATQQYSLPVQILANLIYSLTEEQIGSSLHRIDLTTEHPSNNHSFRCFNFTICSTVTLNDINSQSTPTAYFSLNYKAKKANTCSFSPISSHPVSSFRSLLSTNTEPCTVMSTFAFHSCFF